MSWRDLLRALDEEAAREVEALRTSAAERAERTLAEAQLAIAAERDAALGRARAEAEARRRRALSEAQRDRARTLLAEQRRILDGVRAEAVERLRRDPARSLRAIVGAAAAEVLAAPAAEGGVARSTWVVDPGALDEVRRQLEREHPEVLARAELRAAPEPTGGVEVSVGRRVLDGTAAARVERAWPEVEPRLAQLLFGGLA